MQHLEVSCAVRPIYWPLVVKWLRYCMFGYRAVMTGKPTFRRHTPPHL